MCGTTTTAAATRTRRRLTPDHTHHVIHNIGRDGYSYAPNNNLLYHIK